MKPQPQPQPQSQSQPQSRLADLTASIIHAHDSLDRIAKTLVPLLRSASLQTLGGMLPSQSQQQPQSQYPSAAGSLSLESSVDPLVVLNPATHSAGYLAILTARLKLAVSSDVLPGVATLASLVASVGVFAAQHNHAQVWLAPDLMADFAAALSTLADRTGDPVLPIQPIMQCILKFPVFENECKTSGKTNHAHQLTPLHPILLKHLLLAKMYPLALRVIDKDITSIDKAAFHVRIQDFLLYYYYAGMLMTGLKRFDKAIDFFHLCLSAPAPQVPSQIQIEAYRKSILISLIHTGAVTPPPHYTSQSVLRACTSTSTAFTDFAKQFEMGILSKVQAEMNKSLHVFSSTKTLGLVKQCIASMVRRKIVNLTQTYLTLSLADMAKAVGLEGELGVKEVEMEVVHLIEEGKIFAKISHADGGMVSFLDSPEHYNSVSTLHHLDKSLASVLNFSKLVDEMDKDIGISKEYLNKLDNRVGERQFGMADRFGSSSFEEINE